VQHFPELRTLEPGVSLNGERAFEVDPKTVFGVRRSLRCEPRWLIFLERRDKPGLTFARMPPEDAARRLGSALDLPPELPELAETQNATIRSLVERECWLLQHGEDPKALARAIHGFCAVSEPTPQRRVIAGNRPLFLRKGPDLTRRLTPTPLVADFIAAGCNIRLETNNAALVRMVSKSLRRSERAPSTHERFLWRLIDDESLALYPPHAESSGVSADGLQLVNMGQSSFLAADAESRCGVGFLAEEYVKEEGRFAQFVLPRLISLTATALRWEPDRLPSAKITVPARTG
jgi:hypothetical protein